MAQQTAVERLEQQLNKWSDGRFYFPPHLFEEAKQIEKEQIKEAHLIGLIHPLEMEATKQAEQYYNETYGNK